MVLEQSKSLVHKSCDRAEQKFSEQELENIMLNLMQKHGVETDRFNVTEDGHIKINGIPDLKMHTLMLQVEELGLSMRYTKKTLIEVY
jgi:hypothetical protein